MASRRSRAAFVAVVGAVVGGVLIVGGSTSGGPGAVPRNPAAAEPTSATTLDPAPAAGLPTSAQAAPPSTAGFRDYALAEAAALRAATTTLTDAVRAGDLAAARAAYMPAHVHYVAVAPLADDSADAVDGRTDTGGARWTGFHRLEKAIFADGSLAGMTPYANALDLDVYGMTLQVARASYAPADLLSAADDLLGTCSIAMVTGEEERYAHTDLVDMAAAVDAAHRAFATLTAAVPDPALARTVEVRFAALTTLLDAHRGGPGWADYTTVPDAQRRALTEALDALAEPLSQMPVPGPS